MIGQHGELRNPQVDSITIGGTVTYGIENTVSAVRPTNLITNGAVNGTTTGLDGRITTLEGWVNQSVTTTSSPNFNYISLNTGGIVPGYMTSGSVNRLWFQIIEDLTDTTNGRYARMLITGKTGTTQIPFSMTILMTRASITYGSAFLYSYEVSDPDTTTMPQIAVYRNPADNMIRVFARPELDSRYSIFNISNSYMRSNVIALGTGALPSNIDGTWVVVMDNEAGLPGPLTYPPNNYTQSGRLWLLGQDTAPTYVLQVDGDAYFNKDVVCNDTVLTTHLKPGGVDSIDSYVLASGTVNITGAFTTTTAYRYRLMNDEVVLRIVGVTTTATATSPIIVTIPAAISCGVQSTFVTDITDGPAADFGAAVLLNVTLTIYKDGAGGSFTNGLAAGFETFILTYFRA
jgi:hypothetical protein